MIEKDYASGKMAEALDADELLILTSVEKVSLSFNTEQEELLGEISVAEAKEYMGQGQFEPNTMLPKVEASAEFVGKRKAEEQSSPPSIRQGKDTSAKRGQSSADRSHMKSMDSSCGNPWIFQRKG